MNPELKAKWLEALRSGDYEQGSRCLRQLSKNNTWGVTTWCGKGGFLPTDTADLPTEAMHVLSAMNDGGESGDVYTTWGGFVRKPGKKYTFLEIADFIERYL